ncbi:MAG: thioredoxin-like domain-containing protein [Polyangiaceae bacterium]
MTTVHAPELDGGRAWLNIDRALTLRELRGSVVVLDFWTYCCINCMHVLPTLRAIEERHRGEPLVVIGVHSGKFTAEGDPDRIREAVERYGVEHPVVADDDMTIWSRFGVRSWPTLVVVRPDGTIAAIAPGEPELEVLDAFLVRELELARKAGTLAAAPPVFHHPAPREHDPLLYPGKCCPLPDGGFALSDSGHHRVLVCAADGTVRATAGSGVRGLADGAFADAAFDDPQGLAFHGGALWVADTRNHAIRRLDLESGRVATVAGTGELGRATPVGRAPGAVTALRSPWDLCPAPAPDVSSEAVALYVAMAGSHQLWRFWPDSGEIELYAGTGVEALDDGPREHSAWAQPSGLTVRGSTLFVADSESSAVRAVDLARGEVRTLIGQGLFDFGDDEGTATEALLQHGLGVAALEGAVLVADTYNNKLKLLELDAAGAVTDVRTVLEGLSEPGSVSVAADGSWLVADTNAHRIVRVAPEDARHARKARRPIRDAQGIPLHGAPTALRGALPRREPGPARGGVEGWFTTLLELPAGVGLGPGSGEVRLELASASGSELSDTAPLRVTVEVSRRSDLLRVQRDRFTLDPAAGSTRLVPIVVQVEALPASVVEAEMVVSIDYVACDAHNHAACVPGKLHARVPVRLMAEGGRSALELRVPLPMLEI